MGAIQRIETEVVLHGRRNNPCWFEPAVAVVPAPSADGMPVVMVEAMQLTGNDIGPIHYVRRHDLGRRWKPAR